ncbi:MAG: integrase core domain-containing protein [Methylocella sp.]
MTSNPSDFQGVGVYLHELMDGFHAERVIGSWVGFYNRERPHSALPDKTPAEAYTAGPPVEMMDNTGALPTSFRWPYLHNRLGSDCSAIKLRLTEPLASFAHSRNRSNRIR